MPAFDYESLRSVHEKMVSMPGWPVPKVEKEMLAEYLRRNSLTLMPDGSVRDRLMKEEPGDYFRESHQENWDKNPEHRTICECGCNTFEITRISGDYETLGKCTQCGFVYSLHSG